MTELTNAKQWKDEPVLHYINYWHPPSLDYEDKLSEASAIEMCTQGKTWNLLYVLQMIKPQPFLELATKAPDMEVTTANCRGSSFSVAESKTNQTEVKENVKFFKSPTKEVMTVSMAVQVWTMGKSNSKEKRSASIKDIRRRRPTFKELQEKKYPSDLPRIVVDLLKKGVIQLPEPKRPEEVGRIANPKYCHYHRIVSQLVKGASQLRNASCSCPKRGG